MSTYKIHKGSDGRVKSFGADVPEFQPLLEDGDTLEFADELPENTFPDFTPPVIITSDNITMLDADTLCQAMGAGEKTAEWLIAKLGL